jgi:nucleoside-diphosphate kinase
MEATFIIIKHDAVQRGLVGEIISRFEKRGFQIVANKMIHLTKERAETHYEGLKNHPYYETIIKRFSSGPGQALVLVGKNAIATVRKMIGSTDPAQAELGSIRGDFGLSVERNIIHGSDSKEAVIREVAIWLAVSDIFSWGKDDINWSNHTEIKDGNGVTTIDTRASLIFAVETLKESVISYIANPK